MKEIMKKHYIVPVSEVVATCPDVIMAGSPLASGFLYEEKVVEGMEKEDGKSKFGEFGFQISDKDLTPDEWDDWTF